jgi:hypothetical protein
MSDLERERQNPKDIALALFRFRARRGIGVYYALLSTVPILVGIMDTLSAPPYLTLISVGLLVTAILLLASLAGMKRFTQMRLAMDLSEQTQTPQKRPNRLLEGARTAIITLLPLVAAVVFQVTGSAILGSLVLIAFAAYIVTYYILVFSRQAQDSILPLRIEDWLVAVLPPALLLFPFSSN